MNTQRPSLFHDNDLITFRLTPADDSRAVFTFVEALNQGNLFDRSGGVFEAAVRAGALYEVVVGDDDRIIGTGMFQPTYQDSAGNQHETELGGLMVHPAARGVGVMGLMLKLMMVHRFVRLLPPDSNERDIAHVIDGNQGPIHGLLAAGFKPAGPVKLHADEFDGAMGHMMRDGEDFVRMQLYRFDPAALDKLLRQLWTLQQQGGRLSPADASLHLSVDFSAVLPADFLQAAIKRIQETSEKA